MILVSTGSRNCRLRHARSPARHAAALRGTSGSCLGLRPADARASSASHTVAPDGSFCVRFVFSPGEVTSVGRLGWGERNVTPASKESGRARRSPSPRPGDTVGSDHTVDAENLQSSALRTEAVRSDRHCAHPSSPRLNQISRELAAPRGGEGGGVSTSPRYF